MRLTGSPILYFCIQYSELTNAGYPRHSQRRAVLDAIATSVSTNEVTWICTDQRPSSGAGSSAAQDYLQAALSRGSRFISVVLNCEAAENERRLTAANRGGPNNTKLTDIGILRTIRESEDLYHFGGPDELELDVSAMSASETAKVIFDFVGERIQPPHLAQTLEP
jgi:hypothetical protein